MIEDSLAEKVEAKFRARTMPHPEGCTMQVGQTTIAEPVSMPPRKAEGERPMFFGPADSLANIDWGMPGDDMSGRPTRLPYDFCRNCRKIRRMRGIPRKTGSFLSRWKYFLDALASSF
jgi:hypothetical protein